MTMKHTHFVKNQYTHEDFQSDLFTVLQVYFSFEDRNAWNDSVSLENCILAEDVYAKGH